MPKNFSVSDDDDFVTMEDPFTKETVNVPSNLKGFIKNIVAFNKKSGSDKLKAEYEELQGKFDTLNEEYEEAKKKYLIGPLNRRNPKKGIAVCPEKNKSF